MEDPQDVVVQQLVVGGKRFALDATDVVKLNSPFLTTLVDPESKFAHPPDGIFQVDADASCFACFLHWSRFGTLPSFVVEKEYFLEQADFWGLRDQVSVELQKIENDRENTIQQEITKELDKKIPSYNRYRHVVEALERAKQHHNFRDDDGAGRIYCATCGSRDYDSRWYDNTHYCSHCKGRSREEKRYTDCKSCKKIIHYKKDLGWCHKCSKCLQCQDPKCPNDGYVSCDYSYWHMNEKPTTTKQLEEELQKMTKTSL